MAKTKVAFQGEKGAFSQVAIQQLLGTKAQVVPCQRFEEVFQSLAGSRVDAAVIPIENTLHGSVHENYDHLLNFNLTIVGETNVRVAHSLIARPGVAFKQIRRVYSHPVALNQCLKFFAANPQLERVPFYDTAGSVKMVIETGLADAAGIASAMSAEIYGGEVLKRNIEDDPGNFTRFFLLKRPGSREARDAGEWRTSLVFRTPNVPGALFRCLSVFALRDISLIKIESRPLRGRPWEYLFYLDFIGRVNDAKCQKALGHLEELTDFVRVLGSYPKGD
jgi:prephenate dehydratase